MLVLFTSLQSSVCVYARTSNIDEFIYVSALQ